RLRRTPSSCGKPMITAWRGISAAKSPHHGSMISPNRGSSGRWVSTGMRTGSSSVNHSTALDDPPDMVHSEVVKELPIVGYLTDYQIRLLANFNRSYTIGATDGPGRVECQRHEDFGRQHFHLRACHRTNEQKVLGRASSGITITGKCYAYASLKQR